MDAVDNHYSFLGLASSASPEAIEAAIQRLSDEAIRLVTTSPESSSDLWERIRQMRRDLLATREGRQVYDEALLHRKAMGGDARGASTRIAPRFRASDIANPGPLRLPAPEPAAVTALPEEHRQAVAWPYALAAAAAVFVAVAGAVLARDPALPSTRRPAAMTLWQLGAEQGSKFVPGHSVTLAWTTVPRASAYRLQIASATGDPPDTAVFARGSKTVRVISSVYRLTVKEQQHYYWRAQALVDGQWLRYSPTHDFVVAKARISEPIALASLTAVGKGGKQARLCWSPAPGATRYRLRVQGRRSRVVRGTCVTLAVRPRSYHWSVTALEKGTRAYAVAAVLQVHAAGRANVKTARQRVATRRIRTARSRGRGGIAPVKRRSVSGPVRVAFAVSRHRLQTPRRMKARRTHALARPKVTVMGHRARTLPRDRKTMPASHRAANPTHRTAKRSPTVHRTRATRGTRRVRVASASTHHATGLPHVPVSPASAPHAPSNQASSVPTLSAAPTPPAQVASTSPPVLAQPAVAPQMPTSTARVGTPPAASSAPPVAADPGPTPTSPKTPVAASTPIAVPANPPAHPAHPDHPVHPDHPPHP